MSGELQIRSGGAVAVDTATLRAAADGFAGVAAEFSRVADLVGSAGTRLFALGATAWEASGTTEVARQRMLAVIDQAGLIVDALRFAADVYEIVELRSERAAAHAVGDAAAVARLEGRLARLIRDNPEAGHEASRAAFAHWSTWPAALALQAPGMLGWIFPALPLLSIPLAWSVQRAVGRHGGGTVPATSRLSGGNRPVTVAPLDTTGAAGAPRSLADTAARIPQGAARVRVERYTMADGSRQFAVYVAGTQTVAPRTREPFDMESNIELYSGQRSASYDAALAALAASGAESGDVVHAFGHSQGAMVTAHLALEGGFDTRTLVSFGSPVEADPGEGTLSIGVRHRDDPVAALQGGGHPAGVGAPGSFVAERTVDPQPGLHDYALAAHGIDGYMRTAELLDVSTDARMARVRDLFDELGGAASIEVTEYSAERVAERPPGGAALSPASSVAG